MEKLSSNTKFNVSSGSGKPVQIDNGKLINASLVFRAVNHGLRQSILKFIDDRKRVHVSEIYKKLNIEQSVTSSHLAILRKANVVKAEREGKVIHYTVNKPRLAQIEGIVKNLIK